MTEQPGPETTGIVVRGARTHNLKNVSLTLPAGRLAIITGVSGSGKSSLAFDTIYAEGQRRYVESLSAYARQFLERMEKPDVDSIDGVSPAIAIRQKNSIRNPRSTVSTTTEIHDYLRLLYRARRPDVLPPVRPGGDARDGRGRGGAAGGAAGGHAAAARVRRAGRARGAGGRGAGRGRGRDCREAGADSSRVDAAYGTAGTATGNGKAAAVAATLDALRKKGFGRLLVDGRGHARSRTSTRRRWPAGPNSTSSSIGWSSSRASRAASPTRSKPPTPRAAARPSRSSCPTRCTCSRSASSAGRAASRTRIRSRACSRSTTRTARARPATASATSSRSTWTSWCRTRRSRSTRTPSSRGASRTTAATSPT